jgi:hypothetical protein
MIDQDKRELARKKLTGKNKRAKILLSNKEADHGRDREARNQH